MIRLDYVGQSYLYLCKSDIILLDDIIIVCVCFFYGDMLFSMEKYIKLRFFCCFVLYFMNYSYIFIIS